jgi:hypothetical protein
VCKKYEKGLVRPERFELPTYCSGGNRSIHLSYGRTSVASVYTDSLRVRLLTSGRVRLGLAHRRVHRDLRLGHHGRVLLLRRRGRFSDALRSH